MFRSGSARWNPDTKHAAPRRRPTGSLPGHRPAGCGAPRCRPRPESSPIRPSNGSILKSSSSRPKASYVKPLQTLVEVIITRVGFGEHSGVAVRTGAEESKTTGLRGPDLQRSLSARLIYQPVMGVGGPPNRSLMVRRLAAAAGGPPSSRSGATTRHRGAPCPPSERSGLPGGGAREA